MSSYRIKKKERAITGAASPRERYTFVPLQFWNTAGRSIILENWSKSSAFFLVRHYLQRFRRYDTLKQAIERMINRTFYIAVLVSCLYHIKTDVSIIRSVCECIAQNIFKAMKVLKFKRMIKVTNVSVSTTM